MSNETRHYENQVATTIHAQIGPKAFRMMGAKNVTAGENGALSWKLGGGAKGQAGRVTHVRVSLDAAADLYTVETIRVNTRAAEMCKTLETFEGIYADQLATVIEGATGFYLSL